MDWRLKRLVLDIKEREFLKILSGAMSGARSADMMKYVIVLIFSMLTGGPLMAAGGAPAVSVGADDRALIEQFRSTWRANDGRTIDQILQLVSKVAHFVPRPFSVAKAKGGKRVITMTWFHDTNNEPGTGVVMSWEIKGDGSYELLTADAKAIDLGWQAFALSLVGDEVAEHVPNPNLIFLHDLTNFNFVTTPHGGLGDVLKKGRCKLGDPVSVDFDKDRYRVQLVVDCAIDGPTFFTRNGAITFERPVRSTNWVPASLFAKRIVEQPPGSWFEKGDPGEDANYQAIRAAIEKAQGQAQ